MVFTSQLKESFFYSNRSYKRIVSQHIYLQDIEVGLFRSDYFFCCANECIKQVEFNTIAASFGCLTSQLVRAYKYWNLVVDILLP